MSTNRKYYEVISEDEKSWETLFNHVINQSKFFEFGIWMDTTDSHFDDINKNIPEMPDLVREDRETQFKNALDDLKKIGFQENIMHFYSTQNILSSSYPYDWHLARLQLDEKLKAALENKKNMIDYIDEETNGHHFEFSHPAFYKDDETVLLFGNHSEMSCHILLSAAEKSKLEQQGIEFSDEAYEVNQNEKKGLMSLEELKAL